ncbi:MAG TPA: cell division protein FtsQ/DivIB [Acidimicrobiales bacterium]|nr:cell division protein FtsQ/DivIB [Acidimicrobiales bacterium]
MTDLLERSQGPVDGPPRIDPRIAQRWVEARRQEGRRRLRIVIGVGSLVVVAGLAAGSLYTPIFAVKHLRVHLSGGPAVTASRIEAEAGLARHPLMIDVNPAAAAARLDADPILGGARVSKHWPGTVDISVAVRTALAQVPAGSSGPGGTRSFALVDPTGRVLGQPAARIPGLPVLSGAGPTPGPGGWLAGSAGAAAAPGAGPGSLVDMAAAPAGPDVPRGAAGALAFLQELPAGLRSAVTTITAGPGPNISVVLNPPRTPTGTLTVQLGDGSQLARKVTALETLLGQADLSGVSSIDLSVPSRPAATLSQPGGTVSGG